jgi:hypothetical protein
VLAGRFRYSVSGLEFCCFLDGQSPEGTADFWHGDLLLERMGYPER